MCLSYFLIIKTKTYYTQAITLHELQGCNMLHKPKFSRVKPLTCAPATPEKIYTVKTGKNAGMKRKVNAKPERVGLLPVSEKTIWTWVKQGKFPQPIKISGNVTVWRMSEVEAWIEEQANIATMEA